MLVGSCHSLVIRCEQLNYVGRHSMYLNRNVNCCFKAVESVPLIVIWCQLSPYRYCILASVFLFVVVTYSLGATRSCYWNWDPSCIINNNTNPNDQHTHYYWRILHTMTTSSAVKNNRTRPAVSTVWAQCWPRHLSSTMAGVQLKHTHRHLSFSGSIKQVRGVEYTSLTSACRPADQTQRLVSPTSFTYQ